MRIYQASTSLVDDGRVFVIIEPEDEPLTEEHAESLVGAQGSATLPLWGSYPSLVVEKAWLTPTGRIHAELRSVHPPS